MTSIRWELGTLVCGGETLEVLLKEGRRMTAVGYRRILLLREGWDRLALRCFPS